MAIYNPKMDWLQEQLDSLNIQRYPNLHLYVCDDCSSTVKLEEIKPVLKKSITAFPYRIKYNNKNLGSNKTFELLTQEAEGEYFAYCDQDDIWLPDKLSILQETIERERAELVCSDMFIINNNGRKIANSITKIRRHHIFRSGTGLTDTLWYSNFASGCALLVRADTAKKSLPFNPYMYYDHYITFFCANRGKIISLEQPLIKHREHGENQSSTLQGVHNRESYKKIRVDKKVDEVRWLKENFSCDNKLKLILTTGCEWMEARQKYIRGDHTKRKLIWKYRKYSPMASLLEIAMPYLPEAIFRLLIWASRKNYI